MNLIAACDTSGTLSPDCLPSPIIDPVTCEIDAASTQVLTLQIIAATNDVLINTYLDELSHLDSSLSRTEILNVYCPDDGSLAATGFRDP